MEINLEEIKSKFLKHDIGLVNFPKKLLVELLSEAVRKIDYYENVLQANICNFNHIDERDFKDVWCDQEYIVIDLLDSVDLTDMPEVK